MRTRWLLLAGLVLLTGCGSTLCKRSPVASTPMTGAPRNASCQALKSSGAPSTDPVRIEVEGSLCAYAIGDFGDGSCPQLEVSDAMARHACGGEADLGITLGDNFYEEGLLRGESRSPIPFDRLWEPHYGRLGVQFYASLGNHDYDDFNPDDEISYESPSWCLPRHFYTFIAGPVQFFALDTDPIADGNPESIRQQKEWLRGALRDSQARWKVVYGHHPILSDGLHGDTARLKEEFLPLLRDGKVNAYIAGHDHDLQFFRPDQGVHFFVAGAGGHDLRRLRSNRRSAWAAEKVPGFVTIQATDEELKISVIGTKDPNQALCSVRITSQGTTEDCPNP